MQVRPRILSRHGSEILGKDLAGEGYVADYECTVMLGEMYQILLLSPTFSLYIFWDRQVDSFIHALVSQTACCVTAFSLDNTNTQKSNRYCREFRAKEKV